MTGTRIAAFLRKDHTPKHIFWAFLCLHVLGWTVIPALVCPNLPLDVAEGYAWGREWIMGTYKHPPMQAWWLEIFAILTGRAEWAHLLASQTAVAIAMWAVWKTGLRITTEKRALIGAMLLEGIVYYNFTSPEFNPNVLQLPFWALIVYSFHRAMRENRLIDWVLLGVWSAGGLYTKYSTVLLLAALALFAIARPETRRTFKSIGPYIAFMIASMLFVPQALWLIDNDFLPFSYAQSRMIQPVDETIIHSLIVAPALFIGSQLLAVVLGILMFIPLLEKPTSSGALAAEEEMIKFNRQFLFTATFGPCILVLITAMFLGLHIHDMWAAPFWNFLGLYGITCLGRPLSPSAVLRFRIAWGVVFLAVLMVFAGSAVLYPYATQKVQRFLFPGKTLSKTIVGKWDERYHTPLRYVAGDTWPAGNIAYYTKLRPHVFINMEPKINPWIDEQAFNEKGGVIVWCIRSCSFGNRKQDTPAYVTQTKRAEIQTPIIIPKLTGADVPPAEIGWAIVPPEAR